MKSLSVRMALIISSVILVLVVLMATWVDQKLTQYIQEEGVSQTEVNAETLMGSLKTLMLNGNGILAREWLDRMLGVAGIEGIDVVRRDGTPAFNDLKTVSKVNKYLGYDRFQRHIHKPIEKSPHPISGNIMKNALDGKVFSDLSQPGIITVVMPIHADIECLACHGYDTSMTRGVLKLSVSSKAIIDRVSDMKKLVWVGAFFLVVVLAVALYISLRSNVLKPIKALRAAILSAGEGDHSAQIEAVRQDELGDLANVFNQMQRDLARSETRNRAVTDNIVDGILTLTQEGTIDSVNPAVEHIFGYKPGELIGESVNILTPVEQNEEFLLNDLDNGVRNIIVGVAREITGRKKNGSNFPMDVAISDMQLGDDTYYIAIVRDITSRKARIAALHYQAMHDALTDLPNRTLLLDRLQQAIRSAEREGHKLTLILMDLDRFKEVNDTLGHHVGDMLLQQVSNRLRLVLRESDTVARLGGDEFCLLLPTADVTQARFISRKVINSIEKTMFVDGQAMSVGASLGIASYPEHGQTPLELLQRADVAMYHAKRKKKGYAIYDSTIDQNSLRQLAITSELKDAIDVGQLLLHYQPKIDLQKNCLNGVEALVRWNHPVHGLLAPDEFIPMAEQNGLMKPLTIWVLNRVLSECVSFIKGGAGLQVSINISMTNLSDIKFADEIMEILSQYEIRTEQLKLEITETALMNEPENVIKALHKLNAKGLRISIDDFGIGYSSLTYLQQLPVNELKIDKSFGLSLSEDTNSAVIVRSTIDLAHKLGLDVVAEGVENQETLELLQKLGCDIVQGHYLGKPMPIQKLLQWVKEHNWESTKAIS